MKLTIVALTAFIIILMVIMYQNGKKAAAIIENRDTAEELARYWKSKSDSLGKAHIKTITEKDSIQDLADRIWINSNKLINKRHETIIYNTPDSTLIELSRARGYDIQISNTP